YRSLNGFVDRAPLSEDGSIGAFVTLPDQVPTAVGGGTMQLIGRVLVLSGGTGIAGVTDTSQYTQLSGDGSSTTWRTNGSTGHPRMHPGSVSHGGFVYVLGGFRDPDVW